MRLYLHINENPQPLKIFNTTWDTRQEMVLLHNWHDDRKFVWPVKTCAIYFQKFS